MKMLQSAIVLSLLWCAQATAEELVSYASTDPEGNAIQVTAELTLPKQPGPAGQKSAAVILLHSKGGWNYPVTGQYAKALSEAGFLVLEPRLFARGSVPRVPPLAMVYDALRYLAARDDVDGKRVGVAGFSYGGSLALHSAEAWAQATYAKSADLKFAAHAPFYPVCWAFSAFTQGKRKIPGIPADAATHWTGAPVKLFAGGRDGYDDRDPEACPQLISNLPAAYQSNFSVQVYPEATHGWDQQSASFYENIACKGRGCVNSNEANPAITQQSIKDLVDYFGKVLNRP